MSLQRLTDTTFPTIDSLKSIDHIIAQLTTTSTTTTANSTVKNTNNASSFLSTLRQLTHEPTVESVSTVDDLISKYGHLPILTYTREIIVQKLDLLEEKERRCAFIDVLDKLTDFELFQVNELPESLDFQSKLDLVEKISGLRTLINTFNQTYQDSTLVQQLNSKLAEIVTTNVKPNFTTSFVHKLKKWDMKGENASIITEFRIFLDLQLLIITDEIPVTIWAIDCLLASFRTKFVYHFQGNNDTNRIDKPEFALNYATSYLTETIPTMQSIFSYTFAYAIQNTAVVGSFSTWCITSLLNIVKKKFAAEIALLVEKNDLDLLSHYIEEIKKFDECVKFDHAYVPMIGNEWDGLTKDLVLDNETVWSNWLQNEKRFVNERFEEITSMDNAFEIDFEIVGDSCTKPTKSAVNLKNLIENITGNYNSLPLEYQLKFLSEVQLKLLNFYFDTLKNGVYALKGIKSVGVDGVSTLERICRIWCSAKYVIEMMQKWSNETIFIELWASLTSRGDTDLTFFESVISGYNKDILEKIPKLLQVYFERQLNKSLKDYFQENSTWLISSEDATYTSTSLSYLVQAISTDLAFLQRTVSRVTYNSWKLQISDIIANYFEKNVALSNNFNSNGVDKLRMDVDHVFSTLQLVKSYNDYSRLQTILHVLATGETDTPGHPSVDKPMVSMLKMRRG